MHTHAHRLPSAFGSQLADPSQSRDVFPHWREHAAHLRSYQLFVDSDGVGVVSRDREPDIGGDGPAVYEQESVGVG